MVTPEFCTQLEYAITAALHRHGDTEISGFWCDGVILKAPDTAVAIRTFKERRELEGTAFLGPDGQIPYALTLRLTDASFQAVVAGEDLRRFIPSADSAHWLSVQAATQRLAVALR